MIKSIVKIPTLMAALCWTSLALAQVQPWLEQRGAFIINWSQLNIQFTSVSTETAVASLGKQVNQQGEAVELGSYKSHELAAWQRGVQDFQALLKELIAESSSASSSVSNFKALDAVRPYSSNTTYKSSGVVEVLFRYDLPSLALPVASPQVVSEEAAAQPKISNLILLLPAGSKPRLAVDLCFDDGSRLRAASIEATQWSRRLGGLWIKKQADLPKELDPNVTLKVEVASISADACASLKVSQAQKSLIQDLYRRSGIYWLGAG